MSGFSEEMKQVADRLKGLREIMDVSVEEAAEVCHMTPEAYQRLETGTVDIPVGVLQSMAKKYGFELTTLISGEEPHRHNYFVTKKDQGLSIERRRDYKYQSLAYGFANRKADPFMVVAPADDGSEIHFNSHPGQEFNYILEGDLRLIIDKKEVILGPGDSIYFDSTRPHGMRALHGKPAKFLAIIF